MSMTREQAVNQLETELHIILNRPDTSPNKDRLVQAMLMGVAALREQGNSTQRKEDHNV